MAADATFLDIKLDKKLILESTTEQDFIADVVHVEQVVKLFLNSKVTESMNLCKDKLGKSLPLTHSFAVLTLE